METQQLNQLIDQYLLDTISPEDKVRLERLAADDPEVSLYLRESQQAFKAIRLARDRQLRSKMIQWDREDQGEKTGLASKSWWIMVSILFLAMAIYFVGWQWSPARIGQRYFIPGVEMNEGTSLSGPNAGSLQEAEQAFLDQDYEKAILLYSTLQEPDVAGHAYAVTWNILMARLALEGPTAQWMLAMDTLVPQLPGPLAVKAKRMTGWFRSRSYRMIYRPQQPYLVPLHPRFI